MNNKRIIDYVMQSPNNTNPAVLESMLEALISDGGGGSGENYMFFGKGSDTPFVSGIDGVCVYKLSDMCPTADDWANCVFVPYVAEVFEQWGSGNAFAINAEDMVVNDFDVVFPVYANKNKDVIYCDIMTCFEYNEEEGLERGTYIALEEEISFDDMQDGDGYYFFFRGDIGNSDNPGDETSGGRLVLHRSFSSVEEMLSQPQWLGLVKVFDETPTIEQVRGGMFLYTSEALNLQTSLHKFIGISLDDNGIVEEAGSWAVCVGDDAIAMCITEEIKEMAGASETGIYLAAGAISDSDTREVILIGT